MVVYVQRWLKSGKVVIFGKKLLYSVKLLYSDNSGCNRAKWLYSGKVVVFGQTSL